MTRTWSSGPRASVLPLRPLALVKKLAWIACPVCYPSLPHPISVQLHCLQGGGREVPPGKGVSSFLPHGAPTVGFALPVPTHLTRFPFWTLLSCHFPSLLPQWKLWGLQEPSFNPQRGMCVCVWGGAPVPMSLLNHLDPSLDGEGILSRFLEEKGRACVQKGREEREWSGVGHSEQFPGAGPES